MERRREKGDRERHKSEIRWMDRGSKQPKDSSPPLLST
jgi:hypothetical protein